MHSTGQGRSFTIATVGERSENSRKISRREWLRRAAALGLCVPLSRGGIVPLLKAAQPSESTAPCSAPPPAPSTLSPDDANFLDEVVNADFCFFWEQASPNTGLVKDRFNVRAPDTRVVASVAATGFGLTAICIGHNHGLITLPEATERVLTTLRFLWKKLATHRGFFFHFANVETGERVWESEVSSVDTAILLCGVLTCRQYFHDIEITRLASNIFNRVDWTWLSEDTTLLPQGWTPEVGFLPSRWDYYSELMMMYLLGLGSAVYPLPPAAWNAWKRTTFEYDGLRYVGAFAPLFVHQYSQAWFDFRGQRDAYADYFQNSVLATEAHRRFCLELGKEFSDYNDDLWGITASDSQSGYVVWGGPPEIGPIDGTVVPSATAGSLPFLPQSVMRVLRNIRKNYPKAWSQYGFVNAFNPLKDWYDPDVIGIDTGITMLMAENARSGFVWNTFMKNPEVQRGMQRAGFRPAPAAGTQAAVLPR